MEDKVLTQEFGVKNLFQLEVYLRTGGYKSVQIALWEMKPAEVMDEVK